jgi:hypothetical protein
VILNRNRWRNHRSIPKRVYLSKVQAGSRQVIISLAAANKKQVLFPVGIKIHRTFFKFDSIKEILEAWFIIQLFF